MNTPQTPNNPTLNRAGTSLTRLSLYLAIPGALLSAAWITAGRALFGAGGSLVPVFAVSFGPALAIILLLAALYSFKETALQTQGRQAGLPWPTAIVQASTWVLAFIFGILVPDRQATASADTTVSAAASLFGADFVGLSAGFGNTTGILTFAFAVATLLMALGGHRKAAAAHRGIDERVREELERQDSIYDFLD